MTEKMIRGVRGVQQSPYGHDAKGRNARARLLNCDSRKCKHKRACETGRHHAASRHSRSGARVAGATGGARVANATGAARAGRARRRRSLGGTRAARFGCAGAGAARSRLGATRSRRSAGSRCGAREVRNAAPLRGGVRARVVLVVRQVADGAGGVHLYERGEAGEVERVRVLGVGSGERLGGVGLDVHDVGRGAVVGNVSEFLLDTLGLEEGRSLAVLGGQDGRAGR